jgi:hypothetical protein
MRSLNHPTVRKKWGAEVFQNLGVLDSLIVMEAATDNPGDEVDMLRRIADAGGVRFTDSLSSVRARLWDPGFGICSRRLACSTLMA